MDGENVVLQPTHALKIVRNGLVADKLAPQNLAAESALDNHQPKTASTIGRVHVDDHVLVFGNHPARGASS